MARLNRRDFLAGGRTRSRMVFSSESRKAPADVLVTVFMRGGMDGLHTVPPYGDDDYARRRPSLAIPAPGKPGGCVDLDGRFGLHADLSPLSELYRDGALAVVHACGSPDTTLSHFEAMQTMERGVSDGSTTATGWISRHLASLPSDNPSPVRAIALGEMLPKSLQGSLTATAVRSLREFHLAIPGAWGPGWRDLLEESYGAEPGQVGAAGRSILSLLPTLEKLDPEKYAPSGGITYPDGEFGAALKQVAQLIKADVGLEIAALDLNGWDAHVAQSALMTGLMKQLGQGLHALYADLGDRTRRLIVVAMTEFGRRVQENTGVGTDHGRASAMFLLGGGIAGGRVYGDWPGLGKGQVDRDGNLRVTTDYRDVLAEVVSRRLGNPATDRVFPNHLPRYLDVTRSAVG